MQRLGFCGDVRPGVATHVTDLQSTEMACTRARRGSGSTAFRRKSVRMRLIQAGVGGFGSSWIYAVHDSDGFHHVALVDPNPEALRTAGEIAGVPTERQFTRLDAALATVEADGLIDCTPASLHHATSIEAVKA